MDNRINGGSLFIQTTRGNGKGCLNFNALEQTLKYFKGRTIRVEKNTNKHLKTEENGNKKKNTLEWNKKLPQRFIGGINGHYFDLYKQANENYNTSLRNTIFLDILEKYKNNNEDEFLTYDYLFKSIYDSYKLLREYETTDVEESGDNKIKVHNMVMKLICGSKQIENSSSIVFSLSDNLNSIMGHFKQSGCFKAGSNVIKPKVVYDGRDKSPVCVSIVEKEGTLKASSVQLETISNVIDEELNLFEEDLNERISRTASDSRYLLFLKRTSPSYLKLCEDNEEFIFKQEEILKEKGKINEARSTKKKLETIKDLQRLHFISSVGDVSWSQKDIQIFKHSVIKHKNNFNAIKKELPHIPLKDIIKKYYLSKNKTFDHIKKRSGRISDSEIKTIVESEWTQKEIDLFVEKYKSYGKNLSKYQSWINKKEKDLKIFLRYFLKQQKTIKHETPPRLSISKEEILSNWTIDERQIFAIYFPYFNKNWITMATYFPQKTSSDLKLYYSKYFKGLSYNEQKFEASISNTNVLFNTYPVVHVGDKEQDCLFLEMIGIVFKR